MERLTRILLIVLGLTLVSLAPALADLKVNNVIYSWDYAAARYENSMAVVTWNGGWQPFIHRLDDEFDTDVFVSNTITTSLGVLSANTRYAGLMDYGVYHDDNSPLGAPAFRTTRRWSLVWCDRTGDGDFNNDDLRKSGDPTECYTAYKSEDLPIIFQNQLTPCSTGNCFDELVTRLFVSLDKDNDGVVDAAYRVGGVIGGTVRSVCFYAEAQRPAENPVSWTGNPQARVAAGGGEKTVNFNPRGGATAVVITSFSAFAPRWLSWLSH